DQMDFDGIRASVFSGRIASRLGKNVGSGVIDYSVGSDFEYIPLRSVLEWYDAHDWQRIEKAFRGKAVLLGSIFRFEDRLSVPVQLTAWDKTASDTPAVVVHAQVLRNLLNGGLVAPVQPWI